MNRSIPLQARRGILAPIVAAAALSMVGGLAQASQVAGGPIGVVVTGGTSTTYRSTVTSVPNSKTTTSRTAAPAASKAASAAKKR